jgi:hypothetical protein
MIAFAIGVIHAMAPMQKLNEAYFTLRDEITTNDTYSQLKDTFLEVTHCGFFNSLGLREIEPCDQRHRNREVRLAQADRLNEEIDPITKIENSIKIKFL